jgi:hypothetical protein
MQDYAQQERDASAAIERLEQQHMARLTALLASAAGPPTQPLGGLHVGEAAEARESERAREPAAQPGSQARPQACRPAEQQPMSLREERVDQQRQGQQMGEDHSRQQQQPGRQAQQGQQQEPHAQRQQQQEQQQQQQQQRMEDDGQHGPGRQQQAPGPGGPRRRGLQEELQREAARVGADMERVAVEQQLAGSRIEQRRTKKPRTDGISQVWEWLNDGGPAAPAAAAAGPQQA